MQDNQFIEWLRKRLEEVKVIYRKVVNEIN